MKNKFLTAVTLALGLLAASAQASTYILRAPSPGIQPTPAAATATSSAPSDPYWSNVVLGMHMDGANGSTSFSDVKGHALTDSGASISTAQSEFGGASGYFTGSSSYLTTPASSDFQFGTGDFTIEAWVYLTAQSTTYGNTIASTHYFNGTIDTGWQFAVNRSNNGPIGINFYMGDQSGNGGAVHSSGYITTGVWHHVVIERASGVMSAYLDGVAQTLSSTTNTTNDNASNQLVIGSDTDSNLTPNVGNSLISFNGYIDDLRITKGVARYSGNFTPSTVAFPNQ